MNRQWAVQIFSLLAIAAGIAISYFPPAHNAEAMWTLIGSFLGYGIRDLFAEGGLASAMLVPGTSSAPPGGQSGFARVGALVLTAVIAAGLLLTGCAAPGTQRPTPQQVLAQVCPAAQITVASLSVLRGLSTQAHDDLAVALPIVDAVCAAGAAVDVDSLKALNDTALPALLKIVDSAPLDPGVHDQIALGLTIGQIVLASALRAEP